MLAKVIYLLLQELIPVDVHVQFAKSREHVKMLIDVIARIRDSMEKLALVASNYASEAQTLSRELRYLRFSSSVFLFEVILMSIGPWVHGSTGPLVCGSIGPQVHWFASMFEGLPNQSQ